MKIHLPETLSTLPMNRKIPILILFVSIIGAIIIAGISHYSIIKTSQKSANFFWQQQIPLVRSLVTPAIKKENLEHQREAVKKVFSIIVQRRPNTKVMLFKYIDKKSPKSKLNLIIHSRDDINQFLETAKKNSDAKMEDIEVIKANIIPMIQNRLAIKNLEVTSLSGTSSIVIPLNVGSGIYVVYIRAKFKSYYVRLILLYFIAALVSLLITLVGILLVKEAEEPLKKVIESLFTFVNSGDKKLISYKSGDKVGLLLEKYNDLLEDLEVDIPANHGFNHQYAIDNSSSQKAIGQNSSRELNSVQKKLFEKPFSRFSDFQLTMYPKNPLEGEKNFVGGKQDDKKLNLLMGYFNDDSVDASLEKSRIQEQFMALTESHVSADAIALRTWKKFHEISQYEPGMLFISLDTKSKDELTIYRSGKYHLFICDYQESQEIENNFVTERIQLGSLEFTASYMGLQSLDLPYEKKLIIISNEILEILELNANLFVQNVLDKMLLSQDEWDTARKFMMNLLAHIYELLDNTWKKRKIPGIITLINSRL